MRSKEARIKKNHEMRGQTKAHVENRTRETAATGVTNMCLRPAQLRRASQICAYDRDRVNRLQPSLQSLQSSLQSLQAPNNHYNQYKHLSNILISLLNLHRGQELTFAPPP